MSLSFVYFIAVAFMSACVPETDEYNAHERSDCVAFALYDADSPVTGRGDLTLILDSRSKIKHLVVERVLDFESDTVVERDTLFNRTNENSGRDMGEDTDARLTLPDKGWYVVDIIIDDDIAMNVYREENSYRQMFFTDRRPSWYNETIKSCSLYCMLSRSDVYHDGEYWYVETGVELVP